MEVTHLVEHDAEEEEDNVEDLVDHHLVMWHMKDKKLTKYLIILKML